MKTYIILLLTAFCISVNAQKAPVTFTSSPENRKVSVYVDNKLFTELLYADSLYKHVLYPIHTASGKDINRGYPLNPREGEKTDHPHHSGLWLAHGDVNGLDFWNKSSRNKKEDLCKYGIIKFNHIEEINKSDGRISLIADWIDCNNNKLLKEKTTYTFSGSGNTRTIIRTTTLIANGQPVTIKESKEGLIGIRLRSELEESSTGVYRNSLGDTKGDVWGKRAPWVSLDGSLDGDDISIVLFDHIDNPNYPAWSHARGYGLFASNNFGGKSFGEENEEMVILLNPGEEITLNHKVIIKDNGHLSKAAIEKEKHFSFPTTCE